jgi:hypothetical protein
MGKGVLRIPECGDGAGDGIRTRDIDLGKVALYQLSYSRESGILIFHGFLASVKLEHFLLFLFYPSC